MLAVRRWWLLLALVCLAACNGDSPGASSGAAEANTWRSSRSSDGMLTVSAPSDWALTDDSGSRVVFSLPGGASLEIVRTTSGSMDGLTQPEILEGMLAAATAEFAEENQTIEEVGRRVWLGENYIWHEIQYIGSPTSKCDGCRPALYIDFLALPEHGGLITGRYTGPDTQTLSEEEEAALTAVIDSAVARNPGTT